MSGVNGQGTMPLGTTGAQLSPGTIGGGTSNVPAWQQAWPSTGTIAQKMANILKRIGPVSKDNYNEMQKFAFRGVDQFINALHPILASEGVTIAPRVTDLRTDMREVVGSNGSITISKHVSVLVEYAFTATDGSKHVVGPLAGEGIDRGDKATNKALSSAFKYMCIQTFCVPTEDMVDADSDSPVIAAPIPTPAKVEAPKEKAAKPSKAKGTDSKWDAVTTLQLAQVLVAQKKATREAILTLLGAAPESTVTAAINGATPEQGASLYNFLKEKENV